MQGSTYSHPAAPARAIPLGEEPLVTRAKVCAQLRTALQILEHGSFDVAHITEAQTHMKSAQRVLFVAKTMQLCPNLPAHLRVEQQGREGRA